MEFDNIPGRIPWYLRVKTKEPTLELGIVFGCDMYGVRVHPYANNGDAALQQEFSQCYGSPP